MLIPIVAGAILGIAFDYNSFKLGNDYIFDDNQVKANLQTIPKTYTQSQYRMIESSSDANSVMDIDGDLALKAKKGDIELTGYGKMLMKTVNRLNTVEILITVAHETFTETFPSYIPLRPDWQSKNAKDVGTHYIRSITYGGQFMCSAKLIATRDENIEQIKAAVTGNLGISGSLNVNVSGKLEKLSEEVKDISTIEVMASATTGVFNPPSDIKGCLDLAEKYPQMVKDVEGGKGAALKLDIVELSTLSRNYSAYYKNAALEAMLNEVTNMYDDVRTSYSAYDAWDEATEIPEEWDDAANDYYAKVKKAQDEMSRAISYLDPEKGIDQFKAAFDAYGVNTPNKFAREFKNLTHHVEGKPFYWFPYTTAVTSYVHWGSLNCSLPSPKPLFVGYAGTAPVGFGNGGNIECLPDTTPNLVPKNIGDTTVSQINGLVYEMPKLGENTETKSGQTLCAFCKLENATAAYTISGRTDCPEEMKLEYSGFLMTSRDAGTGSSFICMDGNPVDTIPVDDKKFANGNTAALSPVWAQCPDCDEDENKKYVTCVVCSR